MGTVLTRARVVSAGSPIADLVTRPPIVVSPAATLAEVAAAMRADGVSAALVDEGGCLVHERDLAGALADGFGGDAIIGDLRLSPAVVVAGSIPIVAAAGVMLNERADHLVVELAGGAFALVSMTDVTAVLLQAVDPHLWLASLRIAVEGPAEIWLG
jgi:signal-transduction protein with cAMP-binding, CBS, and nucleotidyltransferase domain